MVRGSFSHSDKKQTLQMRCEKRCVMSNVRSSAIVLTRTMNLRTMNLFGSYNFFPLLNEPLHRLATTKRSHEK